VNHSVKSTVAQAAQAATPESGNPKLGEPAGSLAHAIYRSLSNPTDNEREKKIKKASVI
jgi:hypothetical protein